MLLKLRCSLGAGTPFSIVSESPDSAADCPQRLRHSRMAVKQQQTQRNGRQLCFMPRYSSLRLLLYMRYSCAGCHRQHSCRSQSAPRRVRHCPSLHRKHHCWPNYLMTLESTVTSTFSARITRSSAGAGSGTLALILDILPPMLLPVSLFCPPARRRITPQSPH